MSNRKASGNVLVFILIAIFLMGALTMVFIRSGGSSDDTGNHERASVNASKILDRATKIENAVSRLLISGCSQNELSFWTDTNDDGLETAADSNYNATAPSDKSCHIFDQRGGGVSIQTNGQRVWQKVIQDVGTVATDLYYTAQYDSDTVTDIGLSDEACTSINKSLGNGFAAGSLPAADLTIHEFKGAYNVATVLGDNGAEVGMAGIKSGCMIDTGCGAGSCKTFYRVILTR